MRCSWETLPRGRCLLFSAPFLLELYAQALQSEDMSEDVPCLLQRSFPTWNTRSTCVITVSESFGKLSVSLCIYSRKTSWSGETMESTGIEWLKDRFAARVCQHSFSFWKDKRPFADLKEIHKHLSDRSPETSWHIAFWEYCCDTGNLKKSENQMEINDKRRQNAATTKRQNAAGLAKSFQRPSPMNSKMAQRLRATFFTEAADLHAQNTNGSSISKLSRFWHWKAMRRGRHRHIPTGKRLTKHCNVLCFTHTAAQMLIFTAFWNKHLFLGWLWARSHHTIIKKTPELHLFEPLWIATERKRSKCLSRCSPKRWY